ncbi:XRE family transcriptional regulator [Escherichia coli]|nr:XRE family transcriptional regulator [Escherichia coli]
MAAELNVPLNYFFCDDQTTAELALIISRMTDEERSHLVEALKLSSGINHADKK